MFVQPSVRLQEAPFQSHSYFLIDQPIGVRSIVSSIFPYLFVSIDKIGFRPLPRLGREMANRKFSPSNAWSPDLDAPMILAFLDHLEHHRGNAVRSRNIRLSALR